MKEGSIAQLMPGDVLLYRGRGLISDAIRLIDRSQVSHSALFLGRHGQKGRTVGEAIREGVIRRELAKGIEHADGVEARRLKGPGRPSAPSWNGRRTTWIAASVTPSSRSCSSRLCITRNLAASAALAGLIRETLNAAASFSCVSSTRGGSP